MVLYRESVFSTCKEKSIAELLHIMERYQNIPLAVHTLFYLDACLDVAVLSQEAGK